MIESEMPCKFDKKKLHLDSKYKKSINSNKELFCHVLRIEHVFTRTDVDFIKYSLRVMQVWFYFFLVVYDMNI